MHCWKLVPPTAFLRPHLSTRVRDSLYMHWDPQGFLRQGESAELCEKGYALIVVNTAILRTDIFRTVWSNAEIRYCADGGANRLNDAFGADPSMLPDLIKGDLDSLRSDVKDYYADAGVSIEIDKDQYETDLGKCIKSLQEIEVRRQKQFEIIIYGGLTGRLDQTAHTIHVLFKLSRQRERTWVVSEDSVTCLLPTGEHTLCTPSDILGPTCGILPVGTNEAVVSTTGLEWNLENTATSFDTMVSTSNHLKAHMVTITNDQPVVWTAELR